ncbi:YoaK family small membrane protein [Serratia ureilytica]
MKIGYLFPVAIIVVAVVPGLVYHRRVCDA